MYKKLIHCSKSTINAKNIFKYGIGNKKIKIQYFTVKVMMAKIIISRFYKVVKQMMVKI